MPPDLAQPEFRLAIPADAELLLDFMREYYAFDGHHYDREPARKALLGLLTNSSFGFVWLILDSGTPVGYVAFCFGYSLEYLGRDAFIDEFYLIQSHRGRGWGRKTLDFVVEEARQHDVRAIHLEVIRRNVAALEFYRKLGFRDHGHHLMSLRISS
jgi:ribosomal protein S18 acetylase RimI-like enzyme